MPQVALGLFDVTDEEWIEMGYIFKKAGPLLLLIRTSYQSDNEPLPDDLEALTEERISEINRRLTNVGMLVRYMQTGIRGDFEGRFEGIRFVRTRHKHEPLFQ